jgi:peptide/nickel transport system permease protein
MLLVGISIFSFLFADLAPGDFFSEARLHGRISEETLEAMRAQAGINRPVPVRYVEWVRSIARGEFGHSLAYNAPVGPLLWQRIPGTLLLTATATLLAWLLAVPLGIWNAERRGSWLDSTLRVILSVLLAIPELLLTVILLVMAVETGWLPAGGMRSPGAETWPEGARFVDTLRHLVVPVAVLTIGMLPLLVRHVRAAMVESLDAPFALAARAHGIGRRRLLFQHVLPVAMNPLVTLFGLSLGTLLSVSLLVEVIVGWPGLGPLLLEAILARDFALVLGVVMTSAMLLVTGNLAADLLLYRVDPRIRAQ